MEKITKGLDVLNFLSSHSSEEARTYAQRIHEASLDYFVFLALQGINTVLTELDLPSSPPDPTKPFLELEKAIQDSNYFLLRSQSPFRFPDYNKQELGELTVEITSSTYNKGEFNIR
jgi:hypothetical protein